MLAVKLEAVVLVATKTPVATAVAKLWLLELVARASAVMRRRHAAMAS